MTLLRNGSAVLAGQSIPADLEGIFTHFAMADTLDQAHVRMQLARFQDVLLALEKQGLRPPLVHAANSAAAISLGT